MLFTEMDKNPFNQFKIWYHEHLERAIEINDSMTLGTASSDGKISLRTVLLKEYDNQGFVFYTNYNSNKAAQIAVNKKAALLFYWPEAGRQIRIEGDIEKNSDKDSSVYFKTRPRESQIAAWASEQSSVISDRKYLENRYEYYTNFFSGRLVEKPPHWGGFRVIPDWFEFWQNGEFRLHDRITYKKEENSWIMQRLAP